MLADETTKTAQMAMEVDKVTTGTVRFAEVLDPDLGPTDEKRPHTFYMLKGLHAHLGEPTEIVLTIHAHR